MSWRPSGTDTGFIWSRIGEVQNVPFETEIQDRDRWEMQREGRQKELSEASCVRKMGCSSSWLNESEILKSKPKWAEAVPHERSSTWDWLPEERSKLGRRSNWAVLPWPQNCAHRALMGVITGKPGVVGASKSFVAGATPDNINLYQRFQ